MVQLTAGIVIFLYLGFGGEYKGWYCINEKSKNIFVDKGTCSRIVIDFYKCNQKFNPNLKCKSDEEIDAYIS